MMRGGAGWVLACYDHHAGEVVVAMVAVVEVEVEVEIPFSRVEREEASRDFRDFTCNNLQRIPHNFDFVWLVIIVSYRTSVFSSLCTHSFVTVA
jgi:hypothetical protein